MKLRNYTKGRTEKVVTIEEWEGFALNDLFKFALICAGETPTSLFGYTHKVVLDWSGEEEKQYMRFTLYTD